MNKRLLYSTAVVEGKIKDLAQRISKDYADTTPLVCICVLRGAVMFFAELVKNLNKENIILDFVTLSSYESNLVSSNKIKLIHDLRESVEGRHVLVVEDIVDSGHTVNYIRSFFANKNCLSLKIATLIDKPSHRKIAAVADYVAITMTQDAFIAGYGMDYDQRLRNLPAIYEILGN